MPHQCTAALGKKFTCAVTVEELSTDDEENPRRGTRGVRFEDSTDDEDETSAAEDVLRILVEQVAEELRQKKPRKGILKRPKSALDVDDRTFENN